MEKNLKPSRTSISRTALRLVLLSDTHQLHRQIDVPDGDMLIHSGDFTEVREHWRRRPTSIIGLANCHTGTKSSCLETTNPFWRPILLSVHCLTTPLY